MKLLASELIKEIIFCLFHSLLCHHYILANAPDDLLVPNKHDEPEKPSKMELSKVRTCREEWTTSNKPMFFIHYILNLKDLLWLPIGSSTDILEGKCVSEILAR
ncbi:hypothetical protein AMTR_s00017p00117450 [Amborella trichopoda]|uniref:Uncharacterized protein n=1 Tax=Amborella trichopoda TaxID=13333 RepID=W1PLK9_AMBTC|nr:hypothetical protein AMTR_s00017p00117450 [Amborella trichopoda]